MQQLRIHEPKCNKLTAGEYVKDVNIKEIIGTDNIEHNKSSNKETDSLYIDNSELESNFSDLLITLLKNSNMNEKDVEKGKTVI